MVYTKDLKSFGRKAMRVRLSPRALTIMNTVLKKNLNQNFFKIWTEQMSYILGYIVADGCITVSKDRKNRPFSLNITSIDKKHLYNLRKALSSNHKISKKSGSAANKVYQLQIRNQVLANDLINLGIMPRKTSNLNPIKVPEKYFSDFVRGFFDGDGTVYIYKVNGVPQIKAEFISVSSSFFSEFSQWLCRSLGIQTKSIHQTIDKRGERMIRYGIHFYIDDCEKLADFMYGNSSSLYLLRKRKVFEKWKLIKRRHYIKQNYPSKIGWHLNQKVLT